MTSNRCFRPCLAFAGAYMPDAGTRQEAGMNGAPNRTLTKTLRVRTRTLALIAAGGLAVSAASAHAQNAGGEPPLVAAPAASSDSVDTAYDPLQGFNRGSYGLSMA